MRIKSDRVRKRKLQALAVATVYLPIITLGAWCFSLIGCNTTETDPQTKWNKYYENIDTSIDTSVDVEVMELREKLEPHGISVIRVNPNNPEHQRRYQRHLIGI
jgi:hypothetical protein